MRKLVVFAIAVLAVIIAVTNGYCEIKYVDPYVRGGTIVSGGWRDTSHDGNPYNNANYLGYND